MRPSEPRSIVAYPSGPVATVLPLRTVTPLCASLPSMVIRPVPMSLPEGRPRIPFSFSITRRGGVGSLGLDAANELNVNTLATADASIRHSAGWYFDLIMLPPSERTERAASRASDIHHVGEPWTGADERNTKSQPGPPNRVCSSLARWLRRT